ncbi:serine hydrolase [Salipiger bermudensis]|uniref:serine hydrolase n=1 Tax=Salipiger bermudensis TaxID=344736 RepID=UPI001C99CF0A|nr:serine hydrolase [Salipiger bermudensis]MBY6004414.1 serine hydrolase [Salipiger bermudensis]
MRFLAVLFAFLAPAGAVSAGDDEERALRMLLSRGGEEVAMAPAFLDSVPPETLAQVLDGLSSAIGPVARIDGKGRDYVVQSDTHRLPARIAFDAEGRVSTLWFGAPEPRVTDLASAEALLNELGEDVAWLATRDGTVISEQRAAEPLAVGSAFKIGVLAALVEEIEAGRRDWTDVVRLEERHRSLPSGRMQDFPDDSPVTLHSAALAMIAESDNTASDLLIDLLGHAPVAAQLGIAPEELLTTREFFALKADADRRADWLAAAPAGKPAIAASAAETLPAIEAVMGPHDAGLEWYLPLDRLCALGSPLAALPMMQVNPGPVVAQSGLWQSISYKGGSETGVLNFTAWLTDTEGRQHCVALTVNDPGAIPETTAIAAFGAFLRSLHGQS